MQFPLFETIAIEHGEARNLALHQQRYQQSLARFYPNQPVQIADLSALIKIPAELAHLPLLRCRIDYNQSQQQLAFFPYQRKPYRHFQSVQVEDLDYSLKYSDRTKLNALLEQAKAQNPETEEIIIIQQGKVTDCSIGNLIFRQGDQWFTPDSPLLQGTQRAHLIAQNRIKVRPIFVQDLEGFEEVRLINALNGLD